MFACLVVFGDDASWPEEWPLEIEKNFALIQRKYEKFTFDMCGAWFRDVYKPQILNGDLLQFDSVFKQANKFANKEFRAVNSQAHSECNDSEDGTQESEDSVSDQ